MPKKGYKQTEEHVLNCKRAQPDRSGKNNPNYGNGKKMVGEKNPQYGKTGKKATCYGRTGENHPMYSLSGNKNPNFGSHRNEKQKENISNALKGKHCSPKTEYKKGECSEKDNPFYGKHHTEESIKKISGENSPHYQGGRDASMRRHSGRGWIPLNEKFPGSEGHHLNKELVLYIPKKLHQSVWHNQLTGRGMEEINNLACEYVYGIKTEISRW